MRVAGLEQPPYDTSLMGVVKGALDHFGLEHTSAEAFVMSGHAFVINIHEELCPSAPYVWNYETFMRLVGNLGLDMAVIGTLLPAASTTDEKAALEADVRAALDDGAVCSLLNLENQLVLGYDDAGFIAAQPWSAALDSTPARVTFGTWDEYRHGPPLTFFRFTPSASPSPAKASVHDALDFATEVWENSPRYVEEHYGLGAAAYDNWLSAIDAGHADEHGNWWNAVVWAECRERAGDYFQGLAASEFPGPIDRQQARHLAVDYRALSRLLYRASDRTASAEQKHQFVSKARDLEGGCAERIAELRAH